MSITKSRCFYTEDVNEQDYKTEAYLLVWSCASSHPVIRAHAKRKLCRILCNHSRLFEVLIHDFHSAKDTYILDGLSIMQYMVRCYSYVMLTFFNTVSLLSMTIISKENNRWRMSGYVNGC